MSRKNMMLVLSGSALGLTSVALASPDFDRAYAAELRADAAAHTSLLQAGGSGHDGFFHIGDGSGNNRLNIGGLLQFRYIYNTRDLVDPAPPATVEDTATGFETQRVQLNFGGNVINPNWEYGISLDFGNANAGFDTTAANMGSNLRDAWVQYSFEGDNSGTSLKWGQFVNPTIREDASSDATGIAVERSMVNEFFSGGWVQGVSLAHEGDDYRGSVTVHDGMGFNGIGAAGTAGTEFGGADGDIGLSARFDYKVEGDWAQFDDTTSWKGSNNAFRFGAGFNYQTGGNTGTTPAGTPNGDVDYTVWTVDAQYEGNGWHASAAVIGNTWDSTGMPGGVDVSSTGFLAEGGVFVSDDVELFGRYEFIDLDDSLVAPLADNTQSWLTFGGNFYAVPQSHAAKFTVDCVLALDDQVMPTMSTNNGLGDTGLAGGSDDEFVIRAQFQLVF